MVFLYDAEQVPRQPLGKAAWHVAIVSAYAAPVAEQPLPRPLRRQATRG